MRDDIEFAPCFIGIAGGPGYPAGPGRLPKPSILDENALVALAEINRRMRLPIGVRVCAVAAERRDHRADRDVGLALDLRAGRPRRRVTDVRRRLRERDALSRADALTQKVCIARRDDRAGNPRTRAAIGTQARRARARPAPRAAADRHGAGDAASVRQATLRKAERGQARLRKGRVDLNRQAVRRHDRRIGPALAARDHKAKPDRRKQRPKRLSRSPRRPPARPGGAPAPATRQATGIPFPYPVSLNVLTFRVGEDGANKYPFFGCDGWRGAPRKGATPP